MAFRVKVDVRLVGFWLFLRWVYLLGFRVIFVSKAVLFFEVIFECSGNRWMRVL